MINNAGKRLCVYSGINKPTKHKCKILPTSIPNNLPEWSDFSDRVKYGILIHITENNILTKKLVINDVSATATQTSEAGVLSQCMDAVVYSKLLPPVDGDTNVLSLFNIEPQDVISGYGYVGEEWETVLEGHDRPISISFRAFSTLPSELQPVNVIDLYEYLGTEQSIHSCGYSAGRALVGEFTDEDAVFRPQNIEIINIDV